MAQEMGNGKAAAALGSGSAHSGVELGLPLYVCPFVARGVGGSGSGSGSGRGFLATGFCFSLRAAAQSSKPPTLPRSTLN